MNWIVRFKTRPRCLRDRCELWFIRSDGFWYRFNLAGLIPYLGVPVCAGIGYAISLSIDPDPQLFWGHWHRYLPVLLGVAFGVLGGLVVRQSIIGDYYLNEPPERDEQEVERLLTRKKPTNRGKGKKKRPRPIEEE